MRLVRCAGLGLLALVVIAGGQWHWNRLSADPKQEAKPAQKNALDKFVYPGAKPYPVFSDKFKGNISKGIAQLGRYTSEDEPEKIIKWYSEKLTPFPKLFSPGHSGVAHFYRDQPPEGEPPGYKVVAGVHDYREGVKEARPKNSPRPLMVWIATAKVVTHVEDHTLNVVLTRGNDEAVTHIALSLFPGPQKKK